MIYYKTCLFLPKNQTLLKLSSTEKIVSSIDNVRGYVEEKDFLKLFPDLDIVFEDYYNSYIIEYTFPSIDDDDGDDVESYITSVLQIKKNPWDMIKNLFCRV